MNREQFAQMLNGRQYRDEMTKEEHKLAKENGLIVVFGASDDLIEFRGKIYEELGAWEGGEYYFTKDGKFPDEKEQEVLKEYDAMPRNEITAVWCPVDMDGVSWKYETHIPHSTFRIMEDGQIYCIGIVFNHSDLF